MSDRENRNEQRVAPNCKRLGASLHQSSRYLSRTYLFLESEGDASDGANLNSLHKMSGETGDLVSKSLCLDLRDVINDSLVDVEVGGKPI